MSEEEMKKKAMDAYDTLLPTDLQNAVNSNNRMEIWSCFKKYCIQMYVMGATEKEI